jgi:hypothetical protein
MISSLNQLTPVRNLQSPAEAAFWGLPTAHTRKTCEERRLHLFFHYSYSITYVLSLSQIYIEFETVGLYFQRDYGDPLEVNGTVYGLYIGGLGNDYPQLYSNIPSMYQWVQSFIDGDSETFVKPSKRKEF